MASFIKDFIRSALQRVGMLLGVRDIADRPEEVTAEIKLLKALLDRVGGRSAIGRGANKETHGFMRASTSLNRL